MKASKKIVIPTPVKCDFTGKDVRFSGFQVENKSLAAPYALTMGHALLKGNGSGKLILEKLDNENAQAYEISVSAECVTIRGASDVAFTYAMATLLQLADFEDEGIVLPEGAIVDYPEFQYRGVNWNLLVECRGWSQDACDGEKAFLKRFESALDTLAFFKLNCVFVDGVGWSPERFPGYARMMRKLNRMARDRGVKLMFAGYSAGYGAQWYSYDGPTFRNRGTYPDGDVYKCLGSEIAAEMGTCLANVGLLKLKTDNLREFVKAVEPGFLYVHGSDWCTKDQCQKAWLQRCPKCRERWPDDEVNSVNGMAGAFAEFYDHVHDAVSSVRSDDGDYDAARDCEVIMVSPNYTRARETDEQWRDHLEYFDVLSSHLRNKDIFLGFREQFFNFAGDSTPRCRELKEVLGDRAKAGTLYFSSGSSFYNSLPSTADPACASFFIGMDMVVSGSGNAFQEPRQVINAEYMWNPQGSTFAIPFNDFKNNEEFIPYFLALTAGKERPEEVFSEHGLLRVACETLYGPKAADLVVETQIPKTSDSDAFEMTWMRPVSGEKMYIAPLAPLCNKMLPGFIFSWFCNSSHYVQWCDGINDLAIRFAVNLRTLMPEVIELTESAAEKYRTAADLCEPQLPLNPEERAAHLRRVAATCDAGAGIARATQRWLDIFLDAYHALNDTDSDIDKTSLPKRIDELVASIEDVKRPLDALTANAVDPNGGDAAQGARCLQYLLDDCAAMKHTLATEKYLEPKRDSWW